MSDPLMHTCTELWQGLPETSLVYSAVTRHNFSPFESLPWSVKVFCITWPVKDVRAPLVCHNKPSRWDDVIPEPRRPELSPRLIDLFLLLMHVRCHILVKPHLLIFIKDLFVHSGCFCHSFYIFVVKKSHDECSVSVSWRLPLWGQSSAPSLPWVECVTVPAPASGSQPWRKRQASLFSAPSSKSTGLRFERLTSKSNHFSSRPLFVSSRDLTFIWSVIKLSSVVEIFVSTCVSRSVQSDISFLAVWSSH